MKNQMTYPEFNARWIFLIRKIGIALSRKFFSEYYRSTLPLQDKLQILKAMPFNEVDVNLAIEVLQSNCDTKLFEMRNYEWSLFISNQFQVNEPYSALKQQLELTY